MFPTLCALAAAICCQAEPGALAPDGTGRPDQAVAAREEAAVEREPKREGETARHAAARASLEAFLRGRGEEPAKHRIELAGIPIPGWTFFTVTRISEHPAYDRSERAWPVVVRGDGTVVEGPPEPEIARLLASVGLPAAAPRVSLKALSRAVLFLAGGAGEVLGEEEAADWRRHREGAKLAGPSLERTATGSVVLSFWSKAPSGGREPPAFTRTAVRLTREGKVFLSESRASTRAR